MTTLTGPFATKTRLPKAATILTPRNAVQQQPVSQHQPVLQTKLRQESAVVMLMVPFLGLTAAQPVMLSSGIKMMCTGDTLQLKVIISSSLTAVGSLQLPARLTLSCRRMDFSLKCAYAHGTSALRTHLINMSDKQIQLTWPCFKILKEKWKGKVSSNIRTCHKGIAS